MKECPYCAKEMEADAIVCKHCGRHWKTGASQVQIVQPSKINVRLVCLAIVVAVAAIAGNCVGMQRVMH